MKKTLLSILFALITTLSFAQVPSYVPTTGLLGWWPFNGNANDESGNGNNGIVSGATLTTDRFGNSNNAYSFDGINDLIRIPHQNALNLIGDYSITVWYKGNYQNIFNNSWVFIAKRDDNGNCCSPNVPYDVFIPFNNTNFGVPAMAYANGNYSFSVPPNNTPISLDQWQNLTITNTSDLLKFYINGQLIFSENISISLRAPNTADLLIGSVNRELGAEWMDGKLDDIGIWNRALTDCEIQNLYTSTNPTQTTTQTACDSYTWNGQTYSASGTYTGTTENCVTPILNLTITPSTTNTTTQTACDSYTWNGQTYTASGTYTGTTENCVTPILNLTITPSTTNTTTQTACDSYTWNGQTYTTSGTYTGTTANCVTQVLNLTITPSSTITQPASQSNNISNDAQFIVSSSDPSATYQWQTNLGFGFQNLNNAGQYNGTTSSTLNVINLSMSNNNQVFRCIISSGSCTDTSDVAVLTVVNNVGFNELSASKLSIYPNPTNGDFTITGLELVGSISSLSLSDMNGKVVKVLDTKATKFSMASIKPGVYFLNIISGNKQEVLKIVKE